MAKYLVVVAGESNSGGFAENSEATPHELSARAEVQIFNNTSEVFEDLDVGTNNLIDHTGLTDNATHGIEIGLANAVEAGRLADDELFLVKSGQGGSKIAEWADGHASGYRATLFDRVDTAVGLLDAAMEDYELVLFWTQGVNDNANGTNAATWQSATEAFFADFRTRYGANTKIVMTRFDYPMDNTSRSYNDEMEAIAGDDENLRLINTNWLPLRQSSPFVHWNHQSFLVIADRFIDALFDMAGETTETAATHSVEGGEYAANQTVTLTGSIIRYTTDGSIPSSSSPIYTTPLSLTSTCHLRTITIAAGEKLGTSHKTYTIKENFAAGEWDNLGGTANQSGGFLILPAGGDGGLLPPIDIDEDGILVEYRFPELTASQNIVFGLAGTQDTNYVHLPNNYVIYDVGSGGHWNPSANWPGINALSTATEQSFPARYRLSKSGNQLIVETSDDDGLSFNIHTIFNNAFDPALGSPVTQVWPKAYAFSSWGGTTTKIQGMVPTPISNVSVSRLVNYGTGGMPRNRVSLINAGGG